MNKTIVLLILLFLISGCTSNNEEVVVSRVIDGDTFETIGGNTVRLIGINTPEKNEPYYDEAKERLSDLIENKKVILTKDKENKDKYGRLLRYVYVDDIFVNLKLIEEGYATAYSVPPNLKHENEFKYAEFKAKSSKIGIWLFDGVHPNLQLMYLSID